MMLLCVHTYMYTLPHINYTHTIYTLYIPTYTIGFRVPRAHLDRSRRGGPKKEPCSRYAVYTLLYTYYMPFKHIILYYTHLYLTLMHAMIWGIHTLILYIPLYTIHLIYIKLILMLYS